MHASRAPGNTCLSALLSREIGTIEKPINNSKGCGAVMRVAPVALAYIIAAIIESSDLLEAVKQAVGILKEYERSLPGVKQYSGRVGPSLS